MRQLLDMTNQYTTVHHISKMLLLRLLHDKYRIDKRHLTDLYNCLLHEQLAIVYLQPSGHSIQLAEYYCSISYWVTMAKGQVW